MTGEDLERKELKKRRREGPGGGWKTGEKESAETTKKKEVDGGINVRRIPLRLRLETTRLSFAPTRSTLPGPQVHLVRGRVVPPASNASRGGPSAGPYRWSGAQRLPETEGVCGGSEVAKVIGMAPTKDGYKNGYEKCRKFLHIQTK